MTAKPKSHSLALQPIEINELAFAEIAELIADSRDRALQAVNTPLIDLYWKVGVIISRKIETSEWSNGVVPQLAAYIRRTQPGLRGFTRPNLFRMKQFYETCREESICLGTVETIAADASSDHPRSEKRQEERKFYLRTAIQ